MSSKVEGREHPERRGGARVAHTGPYRAGAAPQSKDALALLAVLAVAAILRFAGLAWGLPNAHHWFSYHPDEVMVIQAATRVNLFAGRWDPGFYNYGSLLIYVVSVTSQVIDAWAPLASPEPWQVMARLTVIGRAWVALFGVATVYVAFLIGRRLGGNRAGLLSALAMAILPMHAVHSHFLTVDVPATFFVSLALYHALMWSPERRKAAVWAGVFAGLAAGTKYNAGLVLLAGWAAVLLARGVPSKARWTAVGLMALACGAAFVISTPGVLFASGSFLRDIGYEAQHVRTGHGLVFVNTGPGWWYHLRVNLLQGAGWPLLLLAIGAVFARPKDIASNPSRREWFTLAAFAVPYFALISLAAVRFQRYLMPLLIVLAVWVGVRWAASRFAWVAGLGLAATAAIAVAQVSTMAAPKTYATVSEEVVQGDPRDAVAAWFFANVPAGATVGFTRTPWFFSPPLSAANAGPQSAGLFHRMQATGDYYHRVVPLPDDASAYDSPPDYVVLSDYELGDAMRLAGARFPYLGSYPRDLEPVTFRPGLDPEAERLVRFWNWALSHYGDAVAWSPAPFVSRIPVSRRDLPPHDAFYPYPTLIVLQRKAAPTAADD